MVSLSRPVVSFSTSKGGSGKTTLCVALAGVLAEEGARVAMIDTDPQQSLFEWSQKPGRPDAIDVFSAENEDRLCDVIEQCQATHHLTIIDVQGRASELGNTAMAWSKLIVVPLQPAAFDAAGAANTIKALKTLERARQTQLRYATVMNRLSGAIRSRTADAVREALQAGGVPVAGHFLDREAYRVMTASGGTVFTLTDRQAPGLAKARAESQLFALEVAKLIGLANQGQGASPSQTTETQVAGAVRDAGAAAEAAGEGAPLDETLDARLDEKIGAAA